MKRLLIATDNFLPRWDGIARFLNEIIPRLSADYKITVLCPDYGKAPDYEGVDIIKFPVTKFSVGGYQPPKASFRKINRYVKEADVVFVQTQGPVGAKAIIASWFHKRPVVSYVHSIEWELFSKSIKLFKPLARFFTKIYARMLYNMCSIIMIPFLEVKEMMRRNGIFSPGMTIVHLGIDTEKFRPADKRKAKERLGLDSSRFVVGFTGRLSREKDLSTLTRAFNELNESNDDMTLLVVGEGNRKDIVTGRNMKAVGKKDDVVPYLQAMDVYVLPSLTETTSLSTLEAMSCGVPVISTPVGYVKSYLEERKNGLIFPKGNYLVLKLKIKQLKEDTELRKKLSEQARETVKGSFDWNNTVEKIELVLNQF
ncbi:MAG: glycosyltransferase family 4 protein [Nanobdellota archaeon]